MKTGKTFQRPVRLIRRLDSREYFADPGWTRKPEEALLFGDSIEAARTCARHGLKGVEIAIRFTGASSDLFCTSIC